MDPFALAGTPHRGRASLTPSLPSILAPPSSAVLQQSIPAPLRASTPGVRPAPEPIGGWGMWNALQTNSSIASSFKPLRKAEGRPQRMPSPRGGGQPTSSPMREPAGSTTSVRSDSSPAAPGLTADNPDAIRQRDKGKGQQLSSSPPPARTTPASRRVSAASAASSRSTSSVRSRSTPPPAATISAAAMVPRPTSQSSLKRIPSPPSAGAALLPAKKQRRPDTTEQRNEKNRKLKEKRAEQKQSGERSCGLCRQYKPPVDPTVFRASDQKQRLPKNICRDCLENARAPTQLGTEYCSTAKHLVASSEFSISKKEGDKVTMGQKRLTCYDCRKDKQEKYTEATKK